MDLNLQGETQIEIKQMLVHGFSLRLNRDNRVYSNAENRMIFFLKILTNTLYLNLWIAYVAKKHLMTGNRYVPCACYKLPIMNALWWLVAVCLIFTHSMGLVPGHKSKEMLSFLFQYSFRFRGNYCLFSVINSDRLIYIENTC